MESKKDIGKFFRENLEHLDRTPSTMVWEGIEKDLKEKKKKRRAFIWFFLIAFVCGSISTFTILNLSNSTDTNTGKENKNSTQSENSAASKNSVNINSENERTINPESNSSLTEAENTAKNEAENSTFKNSVSSKENNSKSNGNSRNSTSSSSESVKNNSAGFSGKLTGKSAQKTPRTVNIKSTSIAFENQKRKQQKGNPKGTKSIQSDTAKNNKTTTVLTDTKDKTDYPINNTPSSTAGKIIETTAVDSLKIETTLTEKKKTIPEKEKDSTTETPKEKSFGVIIAPYYGYSYSGKFGDANSLSTQYNVVEEGGKTNSVFGLLVRWMGTEKLGIQTGVGVVQSKRFTQVEKNGSFFSNNMNLEMDAPMSTYSGLFQNDTKVKFYEEYSYIEVPIEAYYVWTEKKFGVASSFGISLFFLNKNDIYLESDTVNRFRIGSSKNATPQNFVANAKVNLFYNLSKRIQLDVYPEIQFQFMSHKDVSNFYPYYLSLKAGISYKL